MAITKEQITEELKSLNGLFNEGTRRLLQLMLQVQNLPDFDAAMEFARQHQAGMVPPAVRTFPQIGTASAQAAPGLSFNGEHPQDRSGQTDHAMPHPTDNGVAAAAAQTVAAIRSGAIQPGPRASAETQAAAAALAEAAANKIFGTRMIQEPPALPEAQVWQFNTENVIREAAPAIVPPGNQVVADALAGAKDVVTQLLKAKGLPAEVIALVEQVGVQDILKQGHPQAPQLTAPSTGPTEVIDEPSPMQLLVGMGSVFGEYLSPEVFRGGRGEIAPKCNDDIKKYSQDALAIELDVLKNYPTGFYTNSKNKAMQFFVKTDQFLAVVDGLPSEVAPLYIHFLGDTEGFTPVQNLGPSEHRIIYSKLDFVLSQVKKKG